MIAHGGLIAKHMLHDVGHEKTFGKPEPYQHVEYRTEQSRERCEQVGNGSGPESERHKDRRLVPGLYLTRVHKTGISPWNGTTWRDSGSHHSMAAATSGSGSCRMTPSSGSHTTLRGRRDRIGARVLNHGAYTCENIDWLSKR